MAGEETAEEHESVLAPHRGRAHLWQLAVIGFVASVVGITLGVAIDWFPTQASEEGEAIDTLWDVLIVCSVPMFVLVTTVVLYSVWRFRMAPGEEEIDGPNLHGNTQIEIVWTAIPAIMLIALCSYAWVVLVDIEEAAAEPALEVRAVGEQFTWTFYYEVDGEQVASPQLYVPRGRQVDFTVQSKDVIHDFWVPAFRMKVDAVRGIDTRIRVTPKTLGRFPVVCAELCGIGHSAMRQTAHVVEPPDFEAWLADRAAGGGGSEGAGGEEGGGGATPAGDGKAVYVENNCGACHQLADAGTSGGVGPSLDEVLPGQDAAAVRASIVDPGAEISQGYNPGLMPATYGDTIQPAQLDALVEYLGEVAGE